MIYFVSDQKRLFESDRIKDSTIEEGIKYGTSLISIGVDTETTGFNPGLHDTMIEIGAVKMKDGALIESFDELINPGVLIDSEITELTGINNNTFIKNSFT